MSLLQISDTEASAIDAQLEGILDWATTRRDEAEQLSMDATRLLSSTSDRLDKISKLGFFKRCWKTFNGDMAKAKKENMQDLVQMQKFYIRYLNMLQEKELLLAHSMLTIKNNLLGLAIKEEETRNLITLLAQRTSERFEKLEHRIDQLEISTNLQGWLLSLEERDYNEKFPTEYIRLFRVINDFYSIKNSDWNYNDLMFMRKAIRTVNIDPKKKISIGTFIDNLIEEIQNPKVGILKYENMLTALKPDSIDNYHNFVIDNISSPVFTTMHSIIYYYEDRQDMIEAVQEKLDMSPNEALKSMLKNTMRSRNIDLSYEFPLAEAAIEILGCYSLVERLANSRQSEGNTQESSRKILPQSVEEVSTNQDSKFVNEEIRTIENSQFVDVENLFLGEWKESDLPQIKTTSDYISKRIVYADKKFWLFQFDSNVLYIHNSLNLQDWNQITTKIISNSNTEITYAECINNHLIVCLGSVIYISTDLETFRKIHIKSDISGQRIDYVDIIFDGNMLHFVGRYEDTTKYTDKSKESINALGDLINSSILTTTAKIILNPFWPLTREGKNVQNFNGNREEYVPNYTYVVFSGFLGDGFSMLSEFCFQNKFKQFSNSGVNKPIIYSNGTFVTALYDQNEYLTNKGWATMIVASNDCQTWRHIHIQHDTDYYKLMKLNGEIFLQGINSGVNAAILDKKVVFSNRSEFGLYIDTFDNYGIAFYSNEENVDEFYITNNFEDWSVVDRPYAFGCNIAYASDYYYGGGYLIVWDPNEHKMLYRELR